MSKEERDKLNSMMDLVMEIIAPRDFVLQDGTLFQTLYPGLENGEHSIQSYLPELNLRVLVEDALYLIKYGHEMLEVVFVIHGDELKHVYPNPDGHILYNFVDDSEGKVEIVVSSDVGYKWLRSSDDADIREANTQFIYDTDVYRILFSYDSVMSLLRGG